jgi:hypothetical protein
LAEPLDNATIAGEGDDQREDDDMNMSQVLEPAALSEQATWVEPSAEPALAPGTRVEVRNRLDGEWSRGFEIISGDANGYRLRRLSDGGELPLTFADDDVRREKKRGTWWY